jgi:hypothetical protein
MEMEDYLLMRKGFMDKRIYDEMLARKQTFILAMTLGQKITELERVWPDPIKRDEKKKRVLYKGVEMSETMRNQLVELRLQEIKRKQNG